MQQQFSENLFCEVNNISENWVVSNLENALGTWNEKLAELWQLITQTPQSFKGGQMGTRHGPSVVIVFFEKVPISRVFEQIYSDIYK